MIIWLASYPRSGNTMLRSMLKQAFGVGSYSRYDDPTDIGMNREVGDQVGHESLRGDFREFYYRELESPKPVFVKTHNHPGDASRAIYVVRDGRSCIVSWYNMLTRAKKRTNVNIEDIILGRKVPFGDWSSHLRAWAPEGNPRVLLLYYRDLLSEPEMILDRIGAFTGLKQTAPWRDNFAKLQALYPEFFAAGSDERNIAQMTESEATLFWQVHGEAMVKFGFAEKVEA
jgi:sulfotransferase family protein